MPKVPKTSTKRPNLTTYQRDVIRFCHSNGMSVDAIRSVKELERADGSKPLKKTILNWINRLNTTGDVQPKKMTGRRRKLTGEQEAEIVRYVEDNPKLEFWQVASKFSKKFQVECKPRTVNSYAIKSKMSTENFSTLPLFLVLIFFYFSSYLFLFLLFGTNAQKREWL